MLPACRRRMASPVLAAVMSLSCAALALALGDPEPPMCSCPCPPAPAQRSLLAELKLTSQAMASTNEVSYLVAGTYGDSRDHEYGSGDTGTVHYDWKLTDVVETACGATGATLSTDRFGVCGKYAAGDKETRKVVCRKVLKYSDNTEVEVEPDWDVTETLTRLKGSTTASAVTPATLFPGESYNCLSSNKPDSTVPCVDKPCEVLELVEVKGECMSRQGATCGSGFRSVSRICKSITHNIVLNDGKLWSGACLNMPDDYTGSVPAPQAGSEKCTMPAGQCAAGHQRVFSLYGACENAAGTALSCSTCTNASCTLKGNRTRTSECKTMDGNGVLGATVADTECEGQLNELKSPCTKQCVNKKYWKTRPYEAWMDQCKCPGTTSSAEPCKGNALVKMRSRMVQACEPDNVGAVEAGCEEALEEPVDEEYSTSLCDACKTSGGEPMCLNGAECVKAGSTATCKCKAGFSGARCHISDKGLRTADGTACAGIVIANGSCCVSGVTDVVTGACCVGARDGCGACAVDDVKRVGFDKFGRCCEGTRADSPVFMTAGFTCCQDPELVDSCGICGGDSSSCNKKAAVVADYGVNSATDFLAQVVTKLGAVAIPANLITVASSPAPATPAGRRLLADENSDFQAATPIAIEAAGFGLAILQASDAPDSMAAPILSFDASVAAVPNNGFCEFGETPANSQGDCPVETACGSSLFVATRGTAGMAIGNTAEFCGGNGACRLLTGTCVCAPGYITTTEGGACGECDSAAGYAMITLSGVGACSLVPAVDVVTPAPSPPPPGVTIDLKKSGLGTGIIVAIAVGAVVVVAVIAVAIFMLLRLRSAKPIDPQA